MDPGRRPLAALDGRVGSIPRRSAALPAAASEIMPRRTAPSDRITGRRSGQPGAPTLLPGWDHVMPLVGRDAVRDERRAGRAHGSRRSAAAAGAQPGRVTPV